MIARLRAGELQGGNFTVPLKEAVLPLLDELTLDARRMGAVNTVFRREGALVGANTDVAGYFAHLDAACPGWNAAPPRVLLLGAGGAARALAWGFLDRGAASVVLANRSRDRAAALAAAIGDSRLSVGAWPVTPEAVAGCDLLVNATSLGMKGQPPLELALPARMDAQIVSDIVYAPLETALLAAARARGARAVDGLGMLLHQAAFAFGHWFGVTPKVGRTLWERVADDVEPGRSRSGADAP